MILDRLEVDHLRIIEHASLAFEPGLNLFVGPNGAGKTTLLEAAHLLVRGKSFRRGGLEDLIQHGQESLAVRGRTLGSAEQAALRLDFQKARGEPVELHLDRRRVRRASTLAEFARVQVFLPEIADLVLGAPNERRRWLDTGLVLDSPDSLKALVHFQHVLRQRNAALRTGQLRQLDVWDFELGASSDALTTLRQECFDGMVSRVEACAAQLCPEVPISIRFHKGFTGDSYVESLGKHRARDVKLRMTHAGPHRVDIRIQVESTTTSKSAGKAASQVLSRGQARALAAAFRLGQAHYLNQRGRPSLLLVDDLGSEMDMRHRERFLSTVKALNLQMLATAIDTQALPPGWRDEIALYELNKGSATPLK